MSYDVIFDANEMIVNGRGFPEMLLSFCTKATILKISLVGFTS